MNPAIKFDLRRCIPMTRAEEHACASEYVRTRDPSLAARLVMANMRLVVMIAHAHRRASCDMVDLIQEGNVGLIHAVERYDPDRGIKLSSYAAWWIRAYILKFSIDNWRLVKAGTTQPQRRLFFNLPRERQKFERLGVEASPRQLALVLNVKEAEVVTMLERLGGDETSLEAPRGARGHDGALGETLSDASARRPDVRVETSEFAQRVQRSLRVFAETLRGRDLEILRRRLWSEEPETLAQLAAGFGVTRERTRQLEGQLKKRIRAYLTKELGDSLPLGTVRARSRQPRLLGDALRGGPAA
jgi:RNA polymerase sigma-32 factor